MAVHCGHVYHLYLPIIGKYKLVVPAYIAPDDKVRFFIINSERTQFQINNPALSSHVLPLLASDNHVFLRHNSWLTCHEAIGGLTVAEIDAVNSCHRCSLDNRTIIAVRELIQESRLYSQIEQDRILDHWPS